jgi:putative hydrolase of the HAD superfamily
MKITTILFDVGDTLHDLTNYTRFARRISIEKLIDQGVSISDVKKSEELFEKIIQNNTKPHADRFFLELSFFRELFKEMNIKVDSRLLNFALNTYRDILRFILTPSAVAIKTLSALKEKRYKLGVITDGSLKSTYEILLRLGITEFFNATIVSEEVGVEKPNPKIFEEALTRLKAKAFETMIVGDNLERDIMGGKKLGMVTVLIERYQTIKIGKKIKPDFRIRRLDELLEILAV